jgi:ribonuclease P protein component
VTSQGFGRKLRLLTACDYKAIFDAADYKVSSSHLLVLAINTGHTDPRLGLVVSKKNIRFAVQRNRIKRLIRESYRKHQLQLSGLDIVVLARKGLDQQDNSAITKLTDKQWQDLIQRRDRQTAR